MTDSATYSPEDNKLRLYVGRVPRDEYEKLRADGWTSTPKQDCNFVAHWTPSRYATALEYGDGEVGDEDQSPEDRAADRAERFSGYRDKRTDEATGFADRYDAGPTAHGYQSQARGERAARRHDRQAGHACDAWGKAEYWQRRTAGVISHALYVSTPGVRMGRIKTLEAEQRKHAASIESYCKTWRCWKKLAAIADPDEQTRMIRHYVGNTNSWSEYPHPDEPENVSSIYCHMTSERRRQITGAEACALYFSNHIDPESEAWQATSWMQWARHYELRLAYENQMLEAQGGRAAHVEMIAGGFIGSKQIQKVNKSAVTGRVVSVALLTPTHGRDVYGNAYPEGVTPPTHRLVVCNIERLSADVYRPPTDEELAAFNAENKAKKAAAPKADPCPLINPTDDDAQRLVDAWNERERDKHEAKNIYTSEAARVSHSSQFEPAKVLRITQAQYSAASKGAYASCETRALHRDMMLARRTSNMYSASGREYDKKIGKPVCNVRITGGGKSCGWGFNTVIVLTDKPQKPFPAEVWKTAAPEAPAFALQS